MTTNAKDTQRNRFLLINLALIGTLIVCLVAVIIIYRTTFAPARRETPSPTPTTKPTITPSATVIPSPTSTATNTPLPTSSPTRTLTPTWTMPPSITPTPPGPATLFPLRVAVDCDTLPLKDWNPQEADRMIALMDDYPNTLPDSARGDDDAAYYQAFTYAVTAGKEGLLRFPDAPQATRWRWGLAYNMALTASQEAGPMYADIIARGLNNGDVEISSLYTWFQANEPRLSLHMVESTPPSGYISSYILEVRGEDGGSAFIWLLESSGAYRAYSLYSGFDFVTPRAASWIISELNNDPSDGDELAIFVTPLPDQFKLDTPLVFNLSRIPARELPTIPELDPFVIGMEFTNYWAVKPNTSGGNDLLFESDIFPACPVTVRRAYGWNGAYFEFAEAAYSLEKPPLKLGYCDFIAGHASMYWGPEAGVSIMEPLLPDWPPEGDAEGNPYPSDALDEWRYRLGVNYILLGDADSARSYFELIVENPTTPSSRWITPANEILKIYQSEDDIYRACVSTEFCQPAFAIQRLLDEMPAGEDALTYLRSAGLSTFASGFFDFDGDDEREQWFTVRHRPLESLEFWMLARHPEGVKPLYVADVNTQVPDLVYLDPDYISPEALHLQPVVFLDSKVAFSMQRAPETLIPFLVDAPLREVYPNRFQMGLDAAEESLFSGGSPEKVKNNLLGMADWPGLLCEGTWSCDPYYYLLGLSSELAGDERGAVEAFCTLWSDYSKSPYTTMARLKLQGGEARPTATPTHTFTPTFTALATTTPTGTISPTVTLLATLTPTITGTLPTPTPTLSPTITNTGAPQPSATPSPSATPTATTGAYPGPTATDPATNTPYP